MINIKDSRMMLRALAALAVVTSSLTLGSCHDAIASKDSSASSLLETRPDASLSKIMRVIADGDASGFASLCVYPLQRPYPLKDIEDSVAMVDYFPVLVDDSFRTRMSMATPDDWENYGWRGWSLRNDQSLWFEDGLWAVTYESPAEAGLKRILAREEMMSLAPEYRDGWAPVMAMAQTDGHSVFRIDTNGGEYRLMQFDDPANVMRQPDLILLGTLRTEGSAASRIFEFSNQTGTKAQYLPDADSQLFLYVSGPNAVDDSIAVCPAYWRDIIIR